MSCLPKLSSPTSPRRATVHNIDALVAIVTVTWFIGLVIYLYGGPGA